MTATIVDDLTDTASDKNRECKGQGIANIGAGLMGGMAGCAMIGQSIINVKSGGRGRLSTFSAGVFLLILIVFLGEWLKLIPMAALVAVMIMVSIGTFSWDSIRNLKHHPMSTNLVMVATVVVVVATHNLAKGYLLGCYSQPYSLLIKWDALWWSRVQWLLQILVVIIRLLAKSFLLRLISSVIHLILGKWLIR
ncbi:sulfate transporter [Shewanella putrefaciens]|nr:sulfate transporter [Shewanella putrefaciens]